MEAILIVLMFAICWVGIGLTLALLAKATHGVDSEGTTLVFTFLWPVVFLAVFASLGIEAIRRRREQDRSHP